MFATYGSDSYLPSTQSRNVYAYFASDSVIITRCPHCPETGGKQEKLGKATPTTFAPSHQEVATTNWQRTASLLRLSTAHYSHPTPQKDRGKAGGITSNFHHYTAVSATFSLNRTAVSQPTRLSTQLTSLFLRGRATMIIVLALVIVCDSAAPNTDRLSGVGRYTFLLLSTHPLGPMSAYAFSGQFRAYAFLLRSLFTRTNLLGSISRATLPKRYNFPKGTIFQIRTVQIP